MGIFSNTFVFLPKERHRGSSGLWEAGGPIAASADRATWAAVAWALDGEKSWWMTNGTSGIWRGVSIYQPLVLNETPMSEFVKNRLLDFSPRNSEPGDLGGAQEIVFLTHARGCHCCHPGTNLRTSDGLLCAQ